jgi:hypothetical protein
MRMARKTKPNPEPPPDTDGWSRFERAVDAALHTAPKHRESKAEKKPEPKPRPNGG